MVGVLGLTVASTGASEKGLRRAGVTNFEKVYLHPGHHAGYYPGARPIHLKLLSRYRMAASSVRKPSAGRRGEADRCHRDRDSISRHGPQSGRGRAVLCPAVRAAKDPVNLAGMLAENVLNGDMPVADWLAVDAPSVAARRPRARRIRRRAHSERDQSAALAAARPLRRAADESGHLDCCGVGQRAYFATRFLAQHGYRSRNLSGGYTTYQSFSAISRTP